ISLQARFVRNKFNAEHHSEPAHIADAVVLCLELVQACFEICTDLAAILDEPAFEQTDRCHRSFESDGIAAECRCVCSLVPVHNVCSCSTGTDRHTRTKALCH